MVGFVRKTTVKIFLEKPNTLNLRCILIYNHSLLLRDLFWGGRNNSVVDPDNFQLRMRPLYPCIFSVPKTEIEDLKMTKNYHFCYMYNIQWKGTATLETPSWSATATHKIMIANEEYLQVYLMFKLNVFNWHMQPGVLRSRRYLGNYIVVTSFYCKSFIAVNWFQYRNFWLQNCKACIEIEAWISRKNLKSKLFIIWAVKIWMKSGFRL